MLAPAAGANVRNTGVAPAPHGLFPAATLSSALSGMGLPVPLAAAAGVSHIGMGATLVDSPLQQRLPQRFPDSDRPLPGIISAKKALPRGRHHHQRLPLLQHQLNVCLEVNLVIRNFLLLLRSSNASLTSGTRSPPNP